MKYIPTIGIETHVQLKTKTKLFAAVDNDAKNAEPNTLISHICVGMPGALPYLNQEAIALACRAAFALGTTPQQFSKFDRKHYFYPDLPKGYQISQFDQPIIIGGKVEFKVGNEQKTVGITRAHLEEDAGKNTHPAGDDYSLVDLNRAGTPLLEIISEPEIHSPEEAKAYVRELYLLMKYADVSDCDLYLGQMRFDVNISVSKDPNKLGVRSEIKNLNSFRSVESAVAYEIKRQTELLEKGEPVVQETRGWDEAKQKTTSQRSKEEAHDYRYMPEPDVPPVLLDDNYSASIKKTSERLPNEWRMLLSKTGISKDQIDELVELGAEFEVDLPKQVASSITDSNEAKTFANWIINVEVPLRRLELEKTGRDLKIDGWVRSDSFLYVYGLINRGMINSNKATELIKDLLLLNDIPKDIDAYAKDKGYLQVSDESEIDEIVDEVISENQQASEDVKSGEMKAIGFLVGQVMAKSKGQANPGLAQKIIKQKLDI